MALDAVIDLPRRGLGRRKRNVIDLADRARDARQWELAAQLYRQALDREPNNAPIWVQYGHALKESGELRDPDKLAQAERAYKTALSLDPNAADSYLQLGHVLKLQHKIDEAETFYLRAFALDPATVYPLEELSGLGWSAGELSELRAMSGTNEGNGWGLGTFVEIGAGMTGSMPNKNINSSTLTTTGPDFVRQQIPSELHFHVDKVFIDDGLILEGWMFHEINEIKEILIIVDSERGSEATKAKIGWPRVDVFNNWRSEPAKRSGFSAGNLAPIELSNNGVNKVTLRAHFEDAHDGSIISAERPSPREISLELLQLEMVDGIWRMECLTDCCSNSLQLIQYTSAVGRWLRHGSLDMRSIVDALSFISPTPRHVPQLPEPVTILVSVYKGKEFLRPFFTSLFLNTRSNFSLILVDNGNEDVTISAYLRAIAAARDNVVLLRVEANRGYVGAMCLAIEHAPSNQHIVVLNTDTVLPPNWLERLIWPILIDPAVGSTTPLTNAGTVCSFPTIGVDNALFLDLPPEEIDAVVARVRTEKFQIELPSGVGFCMAHNRAAIDKIGWYDLDAFGPGYGEENDWCLRARRAGFKNVLVPDLFIYHKHGGVYASGKQVLLERSLAIVNERYPEYSEQVASFFSLDPIARIRGLIAVLLTCHHTGGRRILILDHSLGGGSNLFRDQLVASLTANGHWISLVTWSGGSFKIALKAANDDYTFRMAALRNVVALLDYIKFDEIIINQLADVPQTWTSLEALLEIVSSAGAKVIIYVHDYFSICPSVNLLNHEGDFCNLPDLKVCDVCASKNKHFMLDISTPQNISIAAWRTKMERLLSAAHCVVCFSGDGALRLQKVYPAIADKIKIVPHFADHFPVPTNFAVNTNDALSIGVIGAIHEAKGAKVVRSLAQAIRARGDATIRLTIIGRWTAAIPAPEITVTGPYLPQKLPEELERHRINLVLVPSIWPETFCYVVEEVMSLGLPLAVFDIGAPAERVSLYSKGIVLPMCDGDALLDALVQFAKRITENHSAAEVIGTASSNVKVISHEECSEELNYGLLNQSAWS